MGKTVPPSMETISLRACSADSAAAAAGQAGAPDPSSVATRDPAVRSVGTASDLSAPRLVRSGRHFSSRISRHDTLFSLHAPAGQVGVKPNRCAVRKESWL